MHSSKTEPQIEYIYILYGVPILAGGSKFLLQSINCHKRIEMAIEMANTRFKYLVIPMGLYYSLKDSSCCSEWIDVCYKWIFIDMQGYSLASFVRPPDSKPLEKANFRKHAFTYVGSFTLLFQTKLLSIK